MEKKRSLRKSINRIPPRGPFLWFVYTPTYIHQDFLKIIFRKQRPWKISCQIWNGEFPWRRGRVCCRNGHIRRLDFLRRVIHFTPKMGKSSHSQSWLHVRIAWVGGAGGASFKNWVGQANLRPRKSNSLGVNSGTWGFINSPGRFQCAAKVKTTGERACIGMPAPLITNCVTLCEILPVHPFSSTPNNPLASYMTSAQFPQTPVKR